MTGHSREYFWIGRGEEYRFEKYALSIELSDGVLEVENIGDRTIIIQADSLCAVSREGERVLFGDREILEEDKLAIFYLEDNAGDWYFFDYDGVRVMFAAE